MGETVKKTLIASIALCVSLLAAAQAGKETPLSVGILSDLDSVPIVTASLRGFFASEGANVRIERFTSAMNRDAALQAGAIDMAVSDLLAACFAAEGGFKARAIMATDGLYRLVAAPLSRASSIVSLKGSDIAISRNTIIEYCLDRMLADSGMTAPDVVKIAIPQMPVRLEMLKAGKVAAAVLPEPLASSAILDGAVPVDSSDRHGVNPGVIIASERALAMKPEGIKAFKRAYDRAVSYLKTAKREEYIDDLLREAGFPPAVRDVLLLPAYTPSRQPSRAEAQAVAAWLYARGLVKKLYAPEDLIR
jgi:NitT/TauT family transport system substrate-binding protein